MFAGLFFASCKENTVIPSGVVPAVDNITVFGTDTLTIQSKTVYDDSVATSGYASGYSVYVPAGNIQSDPFFGKTQASFYFQVRPPQDNFTLDQSVYQVDSAVLVLPYSGFSFGDTTNSAGYQTFEAYRCTEKIYYDTVYYASSRDLSMESSPMASQTVYLPGLIRSLYDSTLVAGVKRAPHIRLKINGSTLSDLTGNLGTDKYTNTANFLDFFNAIYVKGITPSNTLVYFSLLGSDIYTSGGIVLYYHTKNSSGNITDTLTASFPYDPTASQTKTGYFAKVSRDYTGTPVQALFNSTAVSDATIAVQNQPGAALELTLPTVSGLPKCLVNKAELVITQIASPLDAVFAPPARLYPVSIDEYGVRRTIADRYPLTSSSALTFIDGYLRQVSLGGVLVNQYVVNLPRELQDAIIQQRKELRLRLNGTQTFYGAYRTTTAGSNYSRPEYRVKLNIVYTKL
ncbi:hypothetical protein GCM10023092_01600 [Rurimicrobium arvi]|uniref:DUF4270 family protein n=2 Tax=Rurimicrobium arvi TaxID=2049916 RepID=A0ABP8MDA2_9BACT